MEVKQFVSMVLVTSAIVLVGLAATILYVNVQRCKMPTEAQMVQIISLLTSAFSQFVDQAKTEINTNGKTNSASKICASLDLEGANLSLLMAGNWSSSIKDVSVPNVVSLEFARNITKAAHCTPEINRNEMNCQQSMCYHRRFRSMDGTCNNLQQPDWGAAFLPLKRLRPPIYDDSLSAPVGSINLDRPSAREASRLLLRTDDPKFDMEYNSLLMQWGQFLSHDISQTTQLPNDTCKQCGALAEGPCMSIPVDIRDANKQRFGCNNGICCIRTFRSSPVCGTGVQSAREQFNEHTAFIDAGMVYGNSIHDLRKIVNMKTGMLKSTIFKKRHYLPFDSTKCRSFRNCKIKFHAGDDRVNIFLGLISIQTLFMREHNRIVKELQIINPHWDGERLFQEARRIVGSLIQIISYKEYLPRILGTSFSKTIGIYRGYNTSIDPSVSNVFATSAFRFGHGQLMQRFERIDTSGETMKGYDFADAIKRPERVPLEQGVDPVMLGLCATHAKRPDSIASQVTDRLFHNSDLASLNIQRGREHGLPGYNMWREHCGLGRATSVDDLSPQIANNETRRRISSLYGSPDKIDLFVGQMLENPVPGGVVGPTVACIIGDQFQRIRDGDRFWYQNPGVFEPDQRLSLEKVNLARILCDNGDNITQVPRDAFAFTEPSKFIPCSRIPSLNLQLWKEK